MVKGKLIKVLLLGAMLTVCFATVACGKQESVIENSAQNVQESGYPSVIKIGYVPVANDAMIANVEGLYDDLGFDYELIEFSSGKDVNNALASNSVDVGYIGTVPCASGIANEMNYKVFWIDGVITQCEGLAVKEGINSVKDLKGKVIGVVTGSTSHYSLSKVLEKNDILESDVTILNGSPTELVAMWEKGDIEAAYIWQPSLESIIDNGGNLIFTSEDAEKIDAMTAVVHVVNTEFASQYPEAVKALVDVFVKAQEIYKENPDKVIEDVAARLEMDIDMCKITIEGYRWIDKGSQASDDYLGAKFQDVLKDTSDFLESQGSILESPDEAVFADSVTNEFVK